MSLISFTYQIVHVTFTASNTIFVESDFVDYAIADINNPIDVGSSGANQTWDFSYLEERFRFLLL